MSDQSLAIWNSLTDIQQRVLLACYQLDQDKETYEANLRAQKHWYRPPASEWRWMYFHPSGLRGDDHGKRERCLQTYLSKAKLTGHVDALGDLILRELIEHRVKEVPYKGNAAQYRMTALGRRVVRAATGEIRERPLEPWTLREHHWRALCIAHAAGSGGVKGEYYKYGMVRWETWLYLRDYRHGQEPLVKMREHGEGDYRWHITEFGKRLYENCYQEYRGLYPDVEVVAPCKTTFQNLGDSTRYEQ